MTKLSLLWLLIPLVITSAVAFPNYVWLRLLCERSPHIWIPANAVVVITAIILRWMPMSPSLMVALLFSWTLATFADRNVQPSQESWFETFIKLAVSSACATFIVIVVCTILTLGLFFVVINENTVWQLLFGGLFAPSSSAIFYGSGKPSNNAPVLTAI